MQNALIHVTKILLENIYCAVATSSLAGQPWNSPVYYSLDSSCHLYWASSIEAVHSRFLAENPRAFISIFDSTAAPRTATGIYLRGEVAVLSDDSLDLVVERHFRRVGEPSAFTAASYLDESPERIYCFTPLQLWVLGTPEPKRGHLIDRRLEVDLTALCQALEKIEREQVNRWFRPIRFL